MNQQDSIKQPIARIVEISDQHNQAVSHSQTVTGAQDPGPKGVLQSAPRVVLPNSSPVKSESETKRDIEGNDPTSPEVLSAIDKAHRPLVPSPVSQGSATDKGNFYQQNAQQEPAIPFIQEPETPPPVHRRFFVNDGGPRFVANKRESSPEKPAKTLSFDEKPRKNKKGGKANVSDRLVDV